MQEQKQVKPKSKARIEIEKYEYRQKLQWAAIKLEPSKSKRFWKRVWFLIVWPWKWVLTECKDWRTLVLFALVMAVMSSEVWVTYIIGFIAKNAGNQTLGNSLLGTASAIWAWWLLPTGSPFMGICVAITVGIKALFDKIKDKKGKNNEKIR